MEIKCLSLSNCLSVLLFIIIQAFGDYKYDIYYAISNWCSMGIACAETRKCHEVSVLRYPHMVRRLGYTAISLLHQPLTASKYLVSFKYQTNEDMMNTYY